MPSIRALSVIAVIFLFLLSTSQDAESVPDVHSRAGVAQAEHLGKVSFPTTCTPEVQSAIEKAVALLHSFQYQQAEHAFTEVSQEDPHCAIAFWGRAMALYPQLWDFPDAKTLKEGREDIEQAQKLDADSERERQYIAAAAAFYQDNPKLSHAARIEAYSTAMEMLSQHNPRDGEAAAFYALSLIALAQEGGNDVANRKKAIAILEPLFKIEPNNPGAAHYLIHATDTPELAPLGLKAARAYAKIAPDSSHALHMPSHIFTRLGLWQESIDSNLAASVAAAKATEMHMAEPHYQTHAMDFLDYAYLQSGQETRARQLVEELKSVPGMKSDQEEVADLQSYFAARNALELHHWREAAALPVPAVRLTWQDTTWWARAIGAARIGDVEGARKDVEKLKEAIAAREAHQKETGYELPAGESIDQREAEAWLAYAEGKSDEATKILRSAAEREEAEGVDSLAIPTREMLGDMLFELKRPSEALAEYQSALKESPNRFDSVYGAARAAQSAGNAEEAKKYFAKLIEIAGPAADRPELQEAKGQIAGKR